MTGTGKIRIVAVSLDVTGTLIHSPRLAELYSQVLARHGADVPSERLRELIPMVWKELSLRVTDQSDRFAAHADGDRGWWNDYLQRICDYEGLPHPGPFAAAELYDRFGRSDAWEIFEDVLPALTELVSARFRLVLTSNWDTRLPLLLDRLDLTRYFEAVVYSGEVGWEKPHREIFYRALEVLALPGEQVLHIGDRRLDDVEGAEAAGMQALHLDRKRGRGDLSDLRQLPGRLSRIDDMLS